MAVVPLILLAVVLHPAIVDARWYDPVAHGLLLSCSGVLSAVIARWLYLETRVRFHPAVLALSVGFAYNAVLLLLGGWLRQANHLEWLAILSIAWNSLFASASVTLIAWPRVRRIFRVVHAKGEGRVWVAGLVVFAGCLLTGVAGARAELLNAEGVVQNRAAFALGGLVVMGLALVFTLHLFLRRRASVLLSFSLALLVYGLGAVSLMIAAPWSPLGWYGHSLNFIALFLVAYGILEANRLQQRQELVETLARRTVEAERTAADLERSELRCRDLVRHATYGIFRSTLAGDVLEANPALVEMLGYGNEAEMLRLNLGRDVYLDAEDRQRLAHRCTAEGRLVSEEVDWRRKDGSTITVRLSGRMVRDRAGNFEGFEVFAENVTERRRLQEQLQQSQKMEAVGRLAGGIAHDFNNLLMVILGYGDLLREQGELPAASRQKAEQIYQAAKRAAELTHQLLAFSRKQVLTPKLLHLNDVVQDTEKMLRRLIGEHIELVTVRRPGLGRVKADPGQLSQVIMNLCVNARDAMPAGGKLTLETANVELDAAAIRHHAGMVPGRYAMLAVSDTGVGMDAETQRHIFEPFYTTKEPGKGTGLGLATVYGIVKQSGGFIWVYSEPHRGTTFKIYLPRAEGPAEEAETGEPAMTAPAGSEVVLVVEDEEGVRGLARDFLATNGYAVQVARDGAEALALAQQAQRPIDLLLTDVVMPGMGGRELAAQLTAMFPRMKTLYMSGYTESSVVQQSMLDPHAAFIQKPFRPVELACRVRELLDAPVAEPVR